MATFDLLDRLGLSSEPTPEDAEDDLPDIPDDVSELDDADELPEDPKPSRKKKAPFSLPSSAPGRATPTERRQVKDALSLLIKAPAGVISMRDPYCGGALGDQADAIVKAMVPIVCRNPAMLRWFTSANAPWLDILALITAFAPVVTTIYGHHVKHTIGGEEAAHGGPDLSAYIAPSV